MEGFITQEDLDAQNWYERAHPTRLGQESQLDRILRVAGANQLKQRPSGEEILRMYRKKCISEELRGQNDFYQKTPYSLKNIVGYFVDLMNSNRVGIKLESKERQDKVAERVISMIPYTR